MAAKRTRKSVSTTVERQSLELQRSPIGIYVGWHAESAAAGDLAREIFRWFRGDPRDIERCASGIPVMYRCSLPKPGDPELEMFPRDAGDVRLRVFVPLIDEHMVTSKAWRQVLHRMTGAARSKHNAKHSTILVLPVALHDGAFQLVGDIARLNFIRGQIEPPRANEAEGAPAERRTRLVLDQLTDAIGRLMVAKSGGFSLGQFDAPPEKIAVFVSHAKSDGASLAEHLRDELRRHGQLETFFDSSDLALGYDFRNGLTAELGGRSSALLVVLTDKYSSRPWCRHELRQMRQPIEDTAHAESHCRIMRLTPVVVVDALQKRSADHLPDVGPAPVLRRESLDGYTLTSEVMRQVLGYAHDLERAREIAKDRDLDDGLLTWLINGPPDVRTIAQLRRQEPSADFRVLFPGPGVTEDAIEDWQDLFPGVTLRRFDDVGVNR